MKRARSDCGDDGLLAWAPLTAERRETLPLKLEQTIPFAGRTGTHRSSVSGCRGQRLFVSALGNDTVEVVDLKAGKRAHTISG